MTENTSNSESLKKSGSSDITFISEYVAPWALPKEEIPAHLVWDPSMKFDCIEILLPSNMSIKEFYNVASYETLNSKIVVRKLKSPNFLGFVVTLNETIKEKHERKEIIIDFIQKGTVTYSHSFVANIYRPYLSLAGDPSPIILKDDLELHDLVKIPLKISGFGNIEVMTEMNIGGKFEPNLEPLYREMTRRVLTSLKAKEQHIDKREGIQINPVYVQKTTKEFIDKIRKGELSLDLTEDDLAEFRTWIGNESNYEKIYDLVSEHLESILIDSLLYYFERYPADGVELSGGNPAIILNSAIQVIRLRFRYRDSLYNEYEPVLVEIPVKDLRIDKRKDLRVPINIRWIRDQISPLEESIKCK